MIDFSESASYDSLWEPESDPTIEDAEDPIESIELENYESEDSDFELDPSEDESSEYENDDEGAINDDLSSLQSEAATSNKENDTIFDPKKVERKANREVQYQRILSSSNPKNWPTYAIPTVENNATSSCKKPALKDAECDICHIKFTKQGFARLKRIFQ